jgi:hypothetical protein
MLFKIKIFLKTCSRRIKFTSDSLTKYGTKTCGSEWDKRQWLNRFCRESGVGLNHQETRRQHHTPSLGLEPAATAGGET